MGEKQSTEKINEEVRKATLSDLPRIDALARKEPEALGFLPRVVIQEAIEKERVNIHEKSGAFVLYTLRKDGITTIQYICVPFSQRGKGIGKLLVSSLPLPIRLKCPTYLPSNDFYRGLGFKYLGFEQNSTRPVNIWQLGEIDNEQPDDGWYPPED